MTQAEAEAERLLGLARQADLVGPDAANLSAPVISRLKRVWLEDHARWAKAT